MFGVNLTNRILAGPPIYIFAFFIFRLAPLMRLQNRGAHWPTYSKSQGRCEVCSKKGIEARPHCKCSMCGVFLCSNEKKNCFLEFHEVDC